MHPDKFRDIFEEAQAKLPEDERVAAPDVAMCGIICEDCVCTLPKGHTNNHIGHGLFGNIILRWQNINAIVAQHVLAKGHEQEQA